jgi:hypothetical protein
LPAALKQSWITDGRRSGTLKKRRKQMFTSWTHYITSAIEREVLRMEGRVLVERDRLLEEMKQGMEHPEEGWLNQPTFPKGEIGLETNIPDLALRRFLAMTQERAIRTLAEKFDKGGIDGIKSFINESKE